MADIRRDPADLAALHAFGVRNLPVLARGSEFVLATKQGQGEVKRQQHCFTIFEIAHVSAAKHRVASQWIV